MRIAPAATCTTRASDRLYSLAAAAMGSMLKPYTSLQNPVSSAAGPAAAMYKVATSGRIAPPGLSHLRGMKPQSINQSFDIMVS